MEQRTERKKRKKRKERKERKERRAERERKKKIRKEKVLNSKQKYKNIKQTNKKGLLLMVLQGVLMLLLLRWMILEGFFFLIFIEFFI